MVEINMKPFTQNKHTEDLRKVVGKGYGHISHGWEANVHQRLFMNFDHGVFIMEP